MLGTCRRSTFVLAAAVLLAPEVAHALFALPPRCMAIGPYYGRGRPFRPGRPIRPPPPPPPPPPIATFGSAGPRMQLGLFQVNGPLGIPRARAAVRLHIDDGRDCYAQSLSTRTNAGGAASVRFVVAPDGAVSASTVLRAIPTSEIAAQCLSAATRQWVFPADRSGRSSVITMSVTFDRRGPIATPPTTDRAGAGPLSLTVPTRVLGDFGPGDARSSGGSEFDDFTMNLRAGQVVTIVARARVAPGAESSLDMFATILAGTSELMQDDDSAGNLNSRIIFTAPRAGRYTLRVTTFGGGSHPGAYEVQTYAGARPNAQ